MSLPGLLEIDPLQGGLDIWLFDHATDHNALAATAGAKVGITLPLFILDPLAQQDTQQWLLDHQKAHDALVAVTGVIGNDLQDVDFKDPRQLDAWLQLNEQEHRAFHIALGT